MAKHTHRGTCQACGRAQAINIKTGEVANHGYTVDWGYFNGVCSGSRKLPLENGKELTLRMISTCRESAATLLATTIEDIDSVTIETTKKDANGRSQKVAIVCRDNEEVRAVEFYQSFEKLAKSKLAKIIRQGNMLNAHADTLAGLIITRHGQDLYPVDAEPERVREYGFKTTGEAYRRAEVLKAEGWKVRVNGGFRGKAITITGSKV